MKGNVLVIEDNAQNLYLVTFMLEKSGFKVFQAETGLEGLEKAKAVKPDLILLDIQLPEMDGYEVARRLKQIDEVKMIPIVAVTSHAMTGDREKVLQAGCDGYLEKPIDPDTFVPTISQFINHHPIGA